MLTRLRLLLALPLAGAALGMGSRSHDYWAAARASPAVAAASNAARSGSDEPRVRFTINDAWRYAPGDHSGAETDAFDDRTWTVINLPHTWNAEDAFTESLEYRRGVGWYRKRLALDPSLRDKRLFLFFEGANQIAEVFVNGRSAGRHVGGYTAFAFDVTALIHFDAPNTIAVRVDNRHHEDVSPLNADFTFYGGVYRDVWLIATEPLHITVTDHASPGVFIDTPEVSEQRATVRIRGTVMSHTPRATRVDVVHRILDAGNAEVAVLRGAVQLAANGTATFAHTSQPIMRPRLWSPRDPYLYRVVTELREAGRLLDRVENPLGFRWFRLDAQRGFFLNGRPLPLYGTNRHQDRPYIGNALPDWAHRQDVELVKATGFNLLRLAHYPQDEAVLDEMDRRGLIGWEEIPVVNIISLSPAFADNAERMLVEMIRQHYNHPSIVFWGYMNEVLLRKPNPMPDGYTASVLALAKRLNTTARAEDSTRATVLAVSFDEIDDGSGVQDVPDVLGLNLYFGWYYRTLEGLGPYLDSLHARQPTRPLLVSEYGADSDERIHAMAPVAFDFSTEHQQRFHETNFRQLRERGYLVGTAVWNQFDFGSKGRHDSKPNLNQKGLFYFDRTPKDVWYYYRAQLDTAPVLHIATRDWPRRAGSRAADAQQPVVVYTNLPQVELIANGAALGVQRPANGTIRWTVPLRAGDNRLEARASNGRTDSFTITYDDRTAFLHDVTTSARVLAVNAGAHYAYVDAGGTVWEPDRAYSPGDWGHVGGEGRLRHHRIYGTDAHGLYQFERVGAQQYRFDVPAGSYDVQLRFVETEHDAAGRRVFNVSINGRPFLRELDLAAHGRWRAFERTAVVAADNGITIQLDRVVGEPTISGVLLRRR